MSYGFNVIKYSYSLFIPAEFNKNMKKRKKERKKEEKESREDLKAESYLTGCILASMTDSNNSSSL